MAIESQSLQTGIRPGTQSVPHLGRQPGRTRRFLPLWLLLPTIVVLLAVQVYPTLYSLVLSVTKTYAGNLSFVGFRNFERLFADTNFIASLQHTAVYTLLYLVLTVSLGLWLAVLLNRRIKLTGLYLILLFIPWVISDVVAGTIWRWMFQQTYGIVQYWLQPVLHNSLFTDPNGAMLIVVLASVWRALAFTIILFLGGLQTVPGEVLESAAIDGASGWQSFWYVTFPLIRPTFLIAVLLTSIRGINSIGLILSIMGRDGGVGNATQTSTLYLYNAVTRDGDFGLGAAASVLLFIVNLGLALVYLRFVAGRSTREEVA